MGDPDLHSDEKILMTTQDVFVKSIPFEAILTNKRIILLDRKKNLIPQKDILLATVGDIVAAENAIRDQTITLSLITSSGETRQLVLTFSRTAGGGRKRERDEWVKLLKELTSSSIQKTIRKVVPSFDQEPKRRVMEQPSSRIEISRPGVKKEIEPAHPMKTIIEPEKTPFRIETETPPERPEREAPIKIEKEITPLRVEKEPVQAERETPGIRIETERMPKKPVETSSLPTGSFCTRCGNRVPPDSVFCNRCGSRVIPEESEKSPETPAVQQVVVETRMPAPKAAPGERKERPIDREIQSIEPLIEGSVPRMTEAPVVPSSKPSEPVKEPEAEPVTQPATPPAEGMKEATSASSAIAQAAQSIINGATSAPETPAAVSSSEEAVTAPPAATPSPMPAAPESPPVPAAQPSIGTPEAAAAGGAPAGSPPAMPAPENPRRASKVAVLVVGILVILAIASVAFLYWNYLSNETGIVPTPTPTPTMTPIITKTPTPVQTTVVQTTVATPTQPQVKIPDTGVWIRVTYANTFKGSAGLAGSLQEVEGTGDQFYMVPTSGGIVEASIQKADGSGEELLVRIYKDGKLVKTGSTTAPKGTVDVQADLRPETTAPTTKATTVSVTQTTVAN